MHVFIVDDDESFGRSVKRLLNARGLSADYFDTAQSFLSAHFLNREDGLALVDVVMPGCDGYSLVGRMREMGCTMPVVLMTGQAPTNAETRAFQAGAVGLLRKPFSEQSLRDLISVGYSKLKKELREDYKC